MGMMPKRKAEFPAVPTPEKKKNKLLNNELISTAASKWSRPVSSSSCANEEDLLFQWIDIDLTEGPILQTNPKKDQPVPGNRDPNATNIPIIRLFGVTRNKESVLVNVHGFVPYLYTTCPTNHVRSESDCHKVLTALSNEFGKDNILGIEYVTDKMSIYGYQFDQNLKLLCIYVSQPALVPKVRTFFEKGGLFGSSLQTFESNVPFILRFLIDHNITGCQWLTLPKQTYAHVKHKKALVSIEVDVVYKNIISHEPVGPLYSTIAPVRILSFDIECLGRDGHFPEASKDPVIQIANVVVEQGNEDVILVRNVFVLNSCKPIVDAQVLSFESESDMLMSWSNFLRTVDPDVLTGYNIDNFDIPYLLNRGRALNLAEPYFCFGRMKNIASRMEKKRFSSAQMGTTENIKTHISGRLSFDLLPLMRRGHTLSSYSLNAVCSHFLKQQKEDVPHGMISILQMGTDEDRHRLALYCLKDALLPMKLLHKLSCLVNYVEMARVTGVPLDFLVDRGQQIKVFSMILRKCRTHNLVVPRLQYNNNANADSAATYEGATVIDPIKAYYQVPIATLDFASLYPSIMQAYNLCFSTLVAPSDVDKLNSGTDYVKSPSGDVFVTETKKKGILPLILTELLTARKKAKKEMNQATDPQVKAVQNGRQLALKISANSVYGFTGANVGQLPCIPIASSVTSYGRQLLFQTKNSVEEHFTIANGYQHDAQVVYGDTDSVMVKFGADSVKDAMPLAEEAATFVTKQFPSPIKLEFEKIYYPYLLMNKKRYAGLLWTRVESYDKLDSKGLETVRRDNCLLVRRMVTNVLKKILIEQNVEGAISYTQHIISELLQNRMDISLLVITKGLKKNADSPDYKVKSAHTELAMRMKKRDPGNAPVLGERIAYVIIDKGNSKNIPLYEKGEDPVYALENSIPIDCDYYLKNQLQNPLERIFEPIIGNLAKVKSTLFTGAHTLKRAKPILKEKSGGMMNFAVKKKKCLGCKSPLAGGSQSKGALCHECIKKEPQLYSQQLSQVNELSNLFTRLWTQCQNCQGSLHQEVICTSKDCPIFYKRIKVQKDLAEAQSTLERFEW